MYNFLLNLLVTVYLFYFRLQLLQSLLFLLQLTLFVLQSWQQARNGIVEPICNLQRVGETVEEEIIPEGAQLLTMRKYYKSFTHSQI